MKLAVIGVLILAVLSPATRGRELKPKKEPDEVQTFGRPPRAGVN